MSNLELLEIYKHILNHWETISHQYNQIKDKHYINIKKHFQNQKDKGEYIVISYPNMKVFIYNDQGIGKLCESFAIKLNNQYKYHITVDQIYHEIKQMNQITQSE